MEIERAREDVLVAGAAAATTVAVAALSGVTVAVDVGPLATLSPVVVYFAYLFTRKGGPYGPWDNPRNWAIGAVLIGVVVLAVAIVDPTAA
ncbi:hypothetical protein JCM18237_04150 [Halorubrum luteum]